MTTHNIEISQKTIFTTVVLLIVGYIVSKITDVIVLVFLSSILAFALNPLVSLLHKKLRFPSSLAILTVYLSMIGLIVVALSFLLPPLIGEMGNLITKLHLPQLPRGIDLNQIQNSLKQYNTVIGQLGTSIPSVFGAIFDTFSGFLVVFTFFMLTYYLLIERHNLHKYVAWFFGHSKAEEQAKRVIDKLELSLGGWVRGELALMSIIGVMTYVGLTIIGVPYALPLAILAGILEAVPNIGPTISAIPAVLLAFFTISPTMGLLTILLYVIIQQLENNIIVPKIMQSSVNVNPIVAILAIIIGLRVGGTAGAVLGIPVFLFVRTVVDELYHGKNPLQKLEETEK